MNIALTEYLADQGIAAFSYQGYQKFNTISQGKFYYTSPVHPDITATTRWIVDSCWETGDIFYISGNMVHKIKYDGTEIASLTLTNPVSISVIQPTFDVLNPRYGTDFGCWIIDETDKVLIQTDSFLNIVKRVTSLTDPVRVITASDNGCYIFDDGLQWLIKFNANLEMESFLNYSSIGILSIADVTSFDSTINAGLCILTNNSIYIISYSNGEISVSSLIYPLNQLSLVGAISDISVQKVNNVLYAVGCSTVGSWIAKYTIAPLVNLQKSARFSYGFCRMVEASQYSKAEDIYVIIEEDPNLLPPECATSSSSTSSSSGSSSSSSSSSMGGSSSSSSSIDSSSSSSSSSGSSSSSSSSSSSFSSNSSSSSIDSSSSSSSSSIIFGPYFGYGFNCPECNGYYTYIGQDWSDTAVYISPKGKAVLTYNGDWGVWTWKLYIGATYIISSGHVSVYAEDFWDYAGLFVFPGPEGTYSGNGDSPNVCAQWNTGTIIAT